MRMKLQMAAVLTIAALSPAAEVIAVGAPFRSQAEICEPYANYNVAASLEQAVKIGVRADAAPFSYLDASGEAKGYIVDLCRAAIEGLGKGDYIKFVPVTSSSRFIDLASGKIDLLCDSSTLTIERSACFDHTLLTFPSGPTLATGRSLADRIAKGMVARIGVLADSSTLVRAKDPIVTQELAKIAGTTELTTETTSFNSYDDMFAALANAQPEPTGEGTDQIDAIFADREIILVRAQSSGAGEFRVRDSYLGYEPFTIYARFGDRDFMLRLDSAMVDIYSSPKIHEILARYFRLGVSDAVGYLVRLQRIPEGNIRPSDK